MPHNLGGGSMFMLPATPAPREIAISKETDGNGFSAVEVEVNAELTDRQIALIRRKFGTAKVDSERCQAAYRLMLAGKTNAEIAARNIYGLRRLADIRAALLPAH